MNQNVITTNTMVKTPNNAVVKIPNKPSDNWKTAAAWGGAIAAVGSALVILGTEMSRILSSRGR